MRMMQHKRVPRLASPAQDPLGGPPFSVLLSLHSRWRCVGGAFAIHSLCSDHLLSPPRSLPVCRGCTVQQTRRRLHRQPQLPPLPASVTMAQPRFKDMNALAELSRQLKAQAAAQAATPTPSRIAAAPEAAAPASLPAPAEAKLEKTERKKKRRKSEADAGGGDHSELKQEKKKKKKKATVEGREGEGGAEPATGAPMEESEPRSRELPIEPSPVSAAADEEPLTGQKGSSKKGKKERREVEQGASLQGLCEAAGAEEKEAVEAAEQLPAQQKEAAAEAPQASRLTFREVYVGSVTDALAAELGTTSKGEEDGVTVDVLLRCLEKGVDLFSPLQQALCLQSLSPDPGSRGRRRRLLKGGRLASSACRTARPFSWL